MKTSYVLFTILFLTNILCAQTIHPDYYDGKVYLKIKDDAQISLLHFNNETDRVDEYPYFQEIFPTIQLQKVFHPFDKIKTPTFENTYQIEFSAFEKIDFLLAELVKNPLVEYVERIPIYRSFYDPNDPNANPTDQWYLDNIKAYNAWDLINPSNTEVVVAIVDDGVKWDHEDLLDNMWVNQQEANGIDFFDDDGNGYIDDIVGWDAADNNNNPSPPSTAMNNFFSHGTHCAGIAGGVTDNNVGVASVSFNQIKIMGCKSVLDNPPLFPNGSPILTHVWESFQYAIVNQADIISCSWGGGGFSATHQNLINQAHNNGIIVVAASGNSGESTVMYPAGYGNVIAVANSSFFDSKNSSSNYGTWIDITAPGTNILSTVATSTSSYDYKSGTSMACPMVSGLLALLKSQDPSLSNTDLINCLYSSADNIDLQNPNFIGLLGAGRINAKKAIQCINGGGGVAQSIALYEPIVISPNPIICDQTFTVQTNLINLGNNTFTGDFGAYIYDFNGNPISWVQILTESNGLQSGFVYNNSLSFTTPALNLEAGDYIIGMFYRPTGASNWIPIEDGDYSNYVLTPVVCGNSCAVPTGIIIDDIGYAVVQLDWNEVPDANTYETRMREIGTTNWINGNAFSTPGVFWGNMDPCTDYEFQVRANCGTGDSNYSTSFLATTEGCNDPYCYSFGLTWDDWIAGVEFNTISNFTGKDYGFGNYVNLSTALDLGSSYNITLTSDTDDNFEVVYWSVWIDFNQDNDFNDNGELVYQAVGNNQSTETGSITIPNNAIEGGTRMRVSMNLDGYSNECDIYDFREVEDYAIFIENPCTTPTAPSVVANGSTTFCQGGTVTLTASNICSGCTAVWSNGMTGNTINVSSGGVYDVVNQNNCGTSIASNSITITMESAPVSPSIIANGSISFCEGESVTLTASNICNGCTIVWSNGETGNSIVVSDSNNYSAVAQNNCGNSSSSNSISTSINSLPTTPVVSANGPVELCQGQNVILTATNICNGCTIIWSNGITGNTVSVNESGSFSATTQNSCGQSIASNSLSVNVAPLPSVPTITSTGITTLCQGQSINLSASDICSGCTVTWSNGMTGNTITISEGGIFTASSQNNCGASSPSNSINISIDETPQAPIILVNGSTALCQGQSVNLTVSNLCSNCQVEWSNGIVGNTINVNIADVFTATMVNECGEGPISTPIVISVITFTPEITINNQCYLAAPNGSNHKWFLDGDFLGDGQFWTAMETGYYTVIMDNNDNCEGISDPIFVEACATNIEELEEIQRFEVFPNPALTHINISFELEYSSNWKLDLMSISGQKIKVLEQSNLGQKLINKSYDLTSLSSGVYLVVLSTNKERAIKKIVVFK